MAFRYDGSGVPEIYNAARRLSEGARETFSRAIGEHLDAARGGRVLDLGCGTGRFSALLRDVLSASVYGVDVSSDMLGQATQRDDLGRIGFVRGKAEALPLRSGSMHAVFTAMVYHHIADKPAALGECARVLRPGGRLLIYTPTREALGSFLWMRFFPTARRIDTERMPSRTELVETVCRAPFTLGRHTVIHRPLTDDLQQYAERVGMRVFSTLQLVPDDEFERGMAELRRHCAAHDRGETVYEDFEVFLFVKSS